MNETPGLQAGRQLRDEGIAQVSLPSHVEEHEEWKAKYSSVIEGLAKSDKPFNSDDVWAIMGDPPCHPNIIGALFNKAVRSKLITPIDYRGVQRASGHARNAKLYIGSKFSAPACPSNQPATHYVLVETVEQPSGAKKRTSTLLPLTAEGLKTAVNRVSLNTSLPKPEIERTLAFGDDVLQEKGDRYYMAFLCSTHLPT